MCTHLFIVILLFGGSFIIYALYLSTIFYIYLELLALLALVPSSLLILSFQIVFILLTILNEIVTMGLIATLLPKQIKFKFPQNFVSFLVSLVLTMIPSAKSMLSYVWQLWVTNHYFEQCESTTVHHPFVSAMVCTVDFYAGNSHQSCSGWHSRCLKTYLYKKFKLNE